MSTDLEFRQDLLEIRLPTIKIRTSQSSDITDDDTGIIEIEKSSSSNGDEECQTPTSREHKIPKMLSCPPAPKKPRRVVLSCKRKLCELQFFEIVAREEVESFFRTSGFGMVDAKSCGVMKRIKVSL